MADRPTGREKKVTSGGMGVHRRGQGSASQSGTHPQSAQGQSGGRPGSTGQGGPVRSSGGGSPLKFIILLIAVLLGRSEERR